MVGPGAADAAMEADQNRVVAWMGWSLIGAALGVFVSGGAVMAAVFGLLETHSVHLGRPDEVAPASAFPEFLALAGMLAYARPWVRALTTAQGMGSGRSVRLTAAVRATTPWVLALQVALVLVPVLDAAQMTTPDRWTDVIVAVLALLPIILILEFPLRFAWASAQELSGAPPVEPSTP
ncbi:hypothetical protein [Deinococcus sp.]|uniref:hypothetical protein n=1 Tax=Deinococcus sp. TaxID=47478 RepID=UPI002869C128|nr:hypothetical protein [Deinococcus sp.]